MIQLKDARTLTYLDNDLIICDPPYNVGYKYNGSFKDSQTQQEYQELFKPMQGHRVVIIHYIEHIIRDIVPILGVPDKVVSWVYNSNLKNRSWRVVAWWNCKPDFTKVRVPYQDMKDKRVVELYKRTGGRALPDWWDINLVKNVSKEKIKGYTNQIPQEVISRIIKITAKEDDTIVDPFSGTGTTPFVAQQLGYEFRAYDINPLAIELSNERISKAAQELF